MSLQEWIELDTSVQRAMARCRLGYQLSSMLLPLPEKPPLDIPPLVGTAYDDNDNRRQLSLLMAQILAPGQGLVRQVSLKTTLEQHNA